MTTKLKYTSSRQADAQLAIARIAAAQRVTAERIAREAKRAARLAELDRLSAEGQWESEDGTEVFCLICGRATDHYGEHSSEQVAAWKAGRR